MKDFFKLLLEILFPDSKKKNCPHCGGSRCFGLCGMNEPAGVSEQDKGNVEESQGDYPARIGLYHDCIPADGSLDHPLDQFGPMASISSRLNPFDNKKEKGYNLLGVTHVFKWEERTIFI